MTRDELKRTLTPIVLNLDLSTEGRSNELGPVAVLFMLKNPDLEEDEVLSIWNSVMAEIVEETI